MFACACVCVWEREQQTFLLIFSTQGPRLKQLRGFWAKTTSPTSSSPSLSGHCLCPSHVSPLFHTQATFSCLPRSLSSSRQCLENQSIIQDKKKTTTSRRALGSARFPSLGASLRFMAAPPACSPYILCSCVKRSTYHVQADKECHTWAS